MVAGYAIGGGHVLHVVCDITIAADNARFGQTSQRLARLMLDWAAVTSRGLSGKRRRVRSGIFAVSMVRTGSLRNGAGQQGCAARRFGA